MQNPRCFNNHYFNLCELLKKYALDINCVGSLSIPNYLNNIGIMMSLFINPHDFLYYIITEAS